MKATKLFFKTRKESPKDADSINANVLIRGGYAKKHMAGVYGLLPLGLMVYRKIENIIREGMNSINGQEILMNVLQPKGLWDETGRFSEISDVMYQFKDRGDKDIGLAPTHEEQVTDIIRHHIKSYKDLPVSLYQIQVKFRNEPRAKSGLLRGREFMMKDMYSFHVDENDFNIYYRKVAKAYKDVFLKIGLETKYVVADGGIFSKYSHEFQVICPTGEDTIYYCDKCDFAENKEIAEVSDGDKCPDCAGKIIETKSIEIGNIFPLKNKFSSAMGARFVDTDGREKDLIMGCYGIGLTRAMAAAVEVYFDQQNNKMIWPEAIAPYVIEIISLNKNKESEELYEKIKDKAEVLYDDRDISAGEKFADADLIGAPKRVIVSEKSIKSGGVELIDLKSGENQIVKTEELISKF
jgi:prolyl-tRNA synthetase